MALPFVSTAAPIAALWLLVQRVLRLEREQWLPAEVLAARRRLRLRRVLARAAEAPYYRAVFHEAGITEPDNVEPHDLERLPFLDRQIMAQHGLDAFLTVDGSDLTTVLTSGSTGTPGRFLRSKLEEADFSARWWRVYAAFGCRAWDSQVNVAVVNKPDRAGPITFMRKMRMLPRVERMDSHTPPNQVLARVRDLTPPILTGYAGAIEALADHVLATGTPVQSPRAVFCTAMEVTDRCLEMTEQAFQAPAVDVYVTMEFGVIAWSCPVRRNVLHVNDDAFVVEVIGQDGKPVPPGVTGELVVTSLDLTSMPLIRYRMGDMAARLPGRCECGRGLGLLTRVQGRTAHAIRRSDGSVITTPFVTSLLCRAQAHEWVRRFQVREEPGRRLRVLLQARRAPSSVQRDTLMELLRDGMGPEFQTAIELVDQIPTAPSGKLQFLVPLAKG